jgi:hypothetical protein
LTPIDPRCRSVTAYPSWVSIVTVLPPLGTVPAKLIVPPAGAATAAPVLPATSMPRCCPPVYGAPALNEKPRKTGPSAGHVQAEAEGTRRSAVRTPNRSTRMTTAFVVRVENGATTVAGRSVVVNYGYSERS